MGRRIFKDEHLQETYERDGFVIIDLLEPDDLKALKAAYDNLHQQSPDKFFTSTYSFDKVYRKKADQVIKSIMAPAMHKYVVNYKAVFGNFMVKPPGKNGECTLHQDWTYVDESRYSAFNVWSPLTTQDKKNGFIRMVKASHRLSLPCRGRNIPTPLYDVRDLIKNEYSTEVVMEPGQAVIFDVRIIHWSPNNLTENTRVATSLVMIPEEATHIYFQRSDDCADKLEYYEVDSNFLTDYGVFEGIDPRIKFKKKVDYTYEPFSEVTFKQAYNKLN